MAFSPEGNALPFNSKGEPLPVIKFPNLAERARDPFAVHYHRSSLRTYNIVFAAMMEPVSVGETPPIALDLYNTLRRGTVLAVEFYHPDQDFTWLRVEESLVQKIVVSVIPFEEREEAGLNYRENIDPRRIGPIQISYRGEP